MKVKRQNHSVLFRGMVLVVAFALAVLCAPIDGFIALAQMAQYTDYSYMTIGRVDEEVSTSVTKGQDYIIPNAYIGGSQNFVVGKVQDDTKLDNDKNVTLKSSKVTVNYSSLALEEIKSGEVSEETDITNKVVVTADKANFGYFVADKIGTYTITYSYTYENAQGKSFQNSYELKVESELSGATVSFENNEKNFVPKIIDLALAKKGDSFKDLNLPMPTLTDEDGKEVENVNFVTSKNDIENTGSYVVVTANGGINSNTVTISKNAENDGLYISGDVFKDANYGAGRYTIRYAYYLDGQFVTATTKTTQVYSVENKYYTDYQLKLELSNDWSDNGQTGVESKLPGAKGVTSKDSKPESEEVDVYYSVKVFYKAKNSDRSYELISRNEYNIDTDGNGVIDEDEEIVKEDGTLADVSKFKPLKDGWYTFEYSITDFYGNTVSSSKGVYEFANIKDEQDPTPVIYDASIKDKDEKFADASHKLASRSVPNSVVVYAIGIDDNVSKAGDDKVELTRKIMTDETVSKLTINDYDEYNLVFNYRDTANKAYQNLLSNNYLIRKQAKNINSDVEMLNWLKDNGYLIVVDNANYTKIYNIFNEDNFFDENIDSASKALEWFKTAEAKTAGFAYLNVNETFGATTADNGMGSGQYYIHYVAKDAAGNEKDISRSMYIGSYEDNDVPEIKFGTTLADSYLPTSKITFDAPTASDNYDTNMLVRTMYRYLDKNGNVVVVKNDDEETISTNHLTDLWTDIANELVDGKLLTEKYSEYHADENDGYVDLTDKSASSYTIDLKEAGSEAVKLQIVVYTYDDRGNANIYGETINISNTIDNYPPQFKNIDTNSDSFQREYEQGQEIELPTMVVNDDAVAYMSFDVNVYYVSGDTKTKVATYDFSSEREILSQSGAGRYTVKAGKFVASFAGEYQASISVKDSKNKTVVSFVNYTVNARTIIQPPVISTSLESQKIELDGDSNYDPKIGIEIPTPSVSYQIPNSVTYDVYSKNPGEFASTDYVVMGVNENGKATNWSTNYGQQGSFKPNAVGKYRIEYKVNLTVYNHKIFTYKEMGWNEQTGIYDEGGYFEFTNSSNGKTAQVVLNARGEFLVTSSTDGDFKIEKSENSIKVVDPETGIEKAVNGTVLENVKLADWFEDIKNYTLKDNTCLIDVDDRIGPKISEYDYVETISTDEISVAEGYKLKIYGIQASDASGINISRSKVVLSWTLANGNTGSQTYEGLINDTEYTIKSSSGNILDGTYRITYTVYDNNNNFSEKQCKIAVGDNIEPILTFDDDFIEDKYEIGGQLKINLDMISFTDNRPFQDGVEPKITLKNTSTDKEIEFKNVGGMLVFDLDEIGSYTLTVEIEDAVGNTATEDFTFEVSAKSQDTVLTYKIIGTILIVISVLVLVGVIVYFIVSKVKLDKELKK